MTLGAATCGGPSGVVEICGGASGVVFLGACSVFRWEAMRVRISVGVPTACGIAFAHAPGLVCIALGIQQLSNFDA